jgi:hypothetical protein
VSVSLLVDPKVSSCNISGLTMSVKILIRCLLVHAYVARYVDFVCLHQIQCDLLACLLVSLPMPMDE